MHPQYTTAAQARVLSVPGSHLVLTAISVGGVVYRDTYWDITQRSIDSVGKIPLAPRYYSISVSIVKELIGLADLVVSVITNSYHYQLGTVRPTIALCPERANIGLYRFAAPCTGTVQLIPYNLAKRQVISHIG